MKDESTNEFVGKIIRVFGTIGGIQFWEMKCSVCGTEVLITNDEVGKWFSGEYRTETQDYRQEFIVPKEFNQDVKFKVYIDAECKCGEEGYIPIRYASPAAYHALTEELTSKQ